MGVYCVHFTFFTVLDVVALFCQLPSFRDFFPSRMQKAISYTQSTWDIKRVILVGSCFKVSLFRFRGGIMES